MVSLFQLLQFFLLLFNPYLLHQPPCALPTHERRTTTRSPPSSLRRPGFHSAVVVPLSVLPPSHTSNLRLVTPRCCIDRSPNGFILIVKGRAVSLVCRREYERAKHRSQPPRPQTSAAEQQPDTRTARLVIFKLSPQQFCRFATISGKPKVKTS